MKAHDEDSRNIEIGEEMKPDSYDPQEIRTVMAGYIGMEFAAKATDEDVVEMARLQDERERAYNAHLFPRILSIKKLQDKYGIESDAEATEI